ncbi:TAP42-like protein [Trinorchestia longiramus]|nr:TAP42-like protein [Trinorchestia longiramus]
MASENESTETVNDLFFSTLKLYKEIEGSSLESNSDELQTDVEKCRGLLERLTLLVSQLGLFSDNEEIEELPTSSIKFLLLPALLGNITIRRHCLPFRPNPMTTAEPTTDNSAPSRDTILKLSKAYFEDFMSRCKDYGLTQRHVPKDKEMSNAVPNTGRPTPEQLQKMSQERDEKIRRFKEKKRLEAQLKQLQQSKTDEDDETTREFYLSWIALAVIDSLEQLESIGMELAMLKRVTAVPPSAASSLPSATSSFQPILLTRDAVQKQVYGLGYPSLPVMTVDELYEQRAKDGWYDKLSGPSSNGCSGAEAEHHQQDSGFPAEPRPDDEQNSDDEESDRNRSRLQQRDEYRDMHRRGWGNTYNRS